MSDALQQNCTTKVTEVYHQSKFKLTSAQLWPNQRFHNISFSFVLYKVSILTSTFQHGGKRGHLEVKMAYWPHSFECWLARDFLRHTRHAGRGQRCLRVLSVQQKRQAVVKYKLMNKWNLVKQHLLYICYNVCVCVCVCVCAHACACMRLCMCACIVCTISKTHTKTLWDFVWICSGSLLKWHILSRWASVQNQVIQVHCLFPFGGKNAANYAVFYLYHSELVSEAQGL